MKTDTKLLLAATVPEGRKAAWGDFAREHGLAAGEASPDQTMWRTAHPAAQFVPEVLKRLHEVAEQIAQLRDD